MKRVGERGEGRFERISWDEALKTVADKLRETVEKYGNESLYWQYLSLIHISRAHETDSYLVCRLLLEKKKKLHQYPWPISSVVLY